MLRLSFLAAACFLMFGIADAADWPKELNGDYVLAEAEVAGQALPPDQLAAVKMSMKDGTYVVKIGDITAKGTLTVDPSKSPATMDIREEEGPNAGKRILAIYEKTATGVRACYAMDGGERPTAFKGDGWFLATYKRVGGEDSGPSPLKVLLISGGCCHDYPGQDKLLSEELAKRANVQVTVVRDEGATGVAHKISIYQNPNWANGYDCVIHNECFSDTKELEWREGIVKPHREGLPAVAIHCAMHCYRAPTNEWFKFVGVTSRRHGSHFGYPMTNVKPEHPIMKGFPAVWQTPKEELYNIESVEPTATPLASGWSPETKRGEANVWINTYGKARVFGTTVGHYTSTMQDPIYLDMVARGLLWACGKLTDDGKPAVGYEGR